MRPIRFAAAALLFAAAADAQPSTASITRPQSRLSLEFAAGSEVLPIKVFSSSFGSDVFAASGGARWLLNDAPVTGLRLSGLFIERHQDSWDQNGQPIRIVDDLRAVFLSLDLSGRVRFMELGVSGGLGLAPSVSSSGAARNGDGSPYGSTSGRIWTASVVIRTTYLVIEQNAVGLLGGSIISNHREYAPLTVGFRIPIASRKPTPRGGG